MAVPAPDRPPMRIGIIAPYDLSTPGGINTQIRAETRALRRRGHYVLVAGPASGATDDGEAALGGTVVVRFSGTESRIAVSPGSLDRVARLLDREPLDVLHVHEPLTPLMPWMAVWRSRVPVVGTFHVCREAGHRFYAAGRPLLRPIVRRLSARIAVSDAACRTVARYFPGDYTLVPNGIEVETWAAPRPRPDLFEHGRPHVLYMGRLERRKGVEHLIAAMALLRGQPAARLIVAGDGRERDDLAARAAASGVDVRFAGRVSDAELPAYVQAADVVCAPAIGGESFGIVLLEAMACGIPVVASRIDGYADLLEATGGGLLVPPADPPALAATVGRLLANPGERSALGRAGAAAAAEYDWSRLALRLEQIFLALVPRAGAGAGTV